MRTSSLPRRVVTVSACVVAGAAAAISTASPDLPGSAVADGAGLSLSATSHSGRTTIVVRDLRGNVVRSTRVVAGAWSLPRPVRGARPEGIAWWGATMVLEAPGKPGRFLVAPVGRGPAQVVDLKRTPKLTFDAISADGLRLFLSEYARDRDVVARIRVYDIATKTLRRRPVVDKLEGDETMAGVPVARARSLDGSTTFTVYESKAHPFVHVLYTEDVISVCIDLPATGSPAAPGRWKITVDPSYASLKVVSSRLHKSFRVNLRNIAAPVQVTPTSGGK